MKYELAKDTEVNQRQKQALGEIEEYIERWWLLTDSDEVRRFEVDTLVRDDRVQNRNILWVVVETGSKNDEDSLLFLFRKQYYLQIGSLGGIKIRSDKLDKMIPLSEYNYKHHSSHLKYKETK